MSLESDRKLALITGGTSGIGLGIALELASSCDLALSYAGNHDKANAAKATILDMHPGTRVELFPLILTSEQTCNELCDQIEEKFSRPVDILVNSAGRLRDGLFLQNDASSHIDMLMEHLGVPMILSRRLAKTMYKNKFGRIVNLSSITARRFKMGQVNYSTVKSGIEGFTKSLARELAHRGITVNAVAPGLIDTPMASELISAFIEDKKALRKKIPVGRVGYPNDIGHLVRFLASNEASYITGQVIDVCGGRSLVGD